MRIRVALVDDHPVVIGGLQAALGSIDDVEIVGRGGTIAEGRALLARDDIDVVLLDVRLPDGNGIELVAQSSRDDGPAVLILSSFETPQYVAAALRFGAMGFLLKTAPLDELVSAIRRVANGESLFTTEQVRQGRTGLAVLTQREREVLRLLLEGHSNDEIGRRIGAARKTVEKHLLHMFHRFGVASRTELAIRADREGWLDVPPERPMG
ncbi:MAG: response regulator transcription factor [Chloroflexi bacterium]|nr:response regulator transcription factor [Chloroflexota bacterium]